MSNTIARKTAIAIERCLSVDGISKQLTQTEYDMAQLTADRLFEIHNRRQLEKT